MKNKKQDMPIEVSSLSDEQVKDMKQQLERETKFRIAYNEEMKCRGMGEVRSKLNGISTSEINKIDDALQTLHKYIYGSKMNPQHTLSHLFNGILNYEDRIDFAMSFAFDPKYEQHGWSMSDRDLYEEWKKRKLTHDTRKETLINE